MTGSASTGQIQPSLFADAFASDSDIPDARLRGFRDFDKAAHERRLDLAAPHAKGVLYIRTKEEALFGTAREKTRVAAAADHTRLGGRVREALVIPKLNGPN